MSHPPDAEVLRQAWIATGPRVLILVCSACGGNKPLAEVRRSDDGQLLLRTVVGHLYDNRNARDQRSAGDGRRRAPANQMLDDLATWPRTFVCPKHGTRTVSETELTEALNRPVIPATLRV